MTTRITIKNESNSNPSQEAVVVVHNPATGPTRQVLKPGEDQDYWITSETVVFVTEQEAR